MICQIAKTANETIRKETNKQTEKNYQTSENSSWNKYYAASIAAENAYLTSYKRTEKTFNTTKKTQDDAYTSTVVTAYVSQYNQLKNLEALFLVATEHANDPNFNVADYFENGGNQGDYQLVMAKQQEGENDSDEYTDIISPIIDLLRKESYEASEWQIKSHMFSHRLAIVYQNYPLLRPIPYVTLSKRAADERDKLYKRLDEIIESDYKTFPEIHDKQGNVIDKYPPILENEWEWAKRVFEELKLHRDDDFIKEHYKNIRLVVALFDVFRTSGPK